MSHKLKIRIKCFGSYFEAVSATKRPDQTILRNRPFVDKYDLSSRYTSKNLLTSILKLADIAKIQQKLNFQKMDISRKKNYLKIYLC
jgi:hypothetical protein